MAVILASKKSGSCQSVSLQRPVFSVSIHLLSHHSANCPVSVLDRLFDPWKMWRLQRSYIVFRATLRRWAWSVMYIRSSWWWRLGVDAAVLITCTSWSVAIGNTRLNTMWSVQSTTGVVLMQSPRWSDHPPRQTWVYLMDLAHTSLRAINAVAAAVFILVRPRRSATL